MQMATVTTALIEKLQKLPPQRIAQVADFVEYLSTRETRLTASQRLGGALSKLDALNLPPLTQEEIEAEIQVARQARAAL
jgi:hypothetical protein